MNEVKIDKSLVGGMVASRDDATIVRSTIDLVQGYLIGHPLPAGAPPAWMRNTLPIDPKTAGARLQP